MRKHYHNLCTKTCTKMIKIDYAGFDRIPLDSLKIHEILPLENSNMRAIPTLASSSNAWNFGLSVWFRGGTVSENVSGKSHFELLANNSYPLSHRTFSENQ